MTEHLVDGVEILLWPHSGGWGAFVAPWAFDLWFDREGRGSIDANRGPLNVGDYPSSVDRYRALDGPSKSKILKAALVARDEYRDLRLDQWEQYSVRLHEPGLDEAAFLQAASVERHRPPVAAWLATPLQGNSPFPPPDERPIA